MKMISPKCFTTKRKAVLASGRDRIKRRSPHWKYLGKNEQDTYMKVLAGLTLLDTEQGNTGMPIVAEHVEGHQRKAVLNFMAMMENACTQNLTATSFLH